MFLYIYNIFQIHRERRMYLLFIFGYFFHYIQEHIGMRNVWDGVEYYAEVHTSFWNSLIHTMFMPWTMLGMYLWLPALLRLNADQAQVLKDSCMTFYFGLYCRISLITTFFVCMLYYYPYKYSSDYYRKHSPGHLLKVGLSCSVIALLIQEVFGHYIGGDAPSRVEAIPNAILYAPFYSISHFRIL